MPLFDFKSVDSRGHPYEGRMAAASASEVRETLEGRGFVRISVQEYTQDDRIPPAAAPVRQMGRLSRGEVDRMEGPDNPAPGIDLETIGTSDAENAEIRTVMQGLRRSALWFLALRMAIFGLVALLLAAGMGVVDISVPDQTVLFVIALVLLVVQFALVRSARRGPLAPLAEWQRLRQKAQYRKAAMLLERVHSQSVFIRRVLPEGYYHGELAILYAMDGDRSRAFEELARAEAARLREPFLSYRKATVYRALKEFAEAEQHYRRALEIDPGSSMLRAELALLYLEAGRDFDQAENLLKEALTQGGSPRSIGLLTGYLGAVSFRRGRIDEADRNIEEGLRNLMPIRGLSPLSGVAAELFYYRALVQKALGHRRRALRALRQARKNTHDPQLLSRISSAEKEIRGT
ncbi:MAG: tetratricopeptide repeat protein [Deltaproteobacteria bacterium]|nr:tetratricopeptide repeat protein [Deltaproteobacteria bacterium]